MLKVRHATPNDTTAISVLVVHAFDQNNEHRLVEGLRAANQIALELVAELDGKIVGHICFSHLVHPKGWWALAPVCVSNELQGEGIGGELIRYGLDLARQRQAKAVVVVGSPKYYRRFGFVFDGPAQIETPYPNQYTGLYPIASDTAAAAVHLIYPQVFEDV